MHYWDFSPGLEIKETNRHISYVAGCSYDWSYIFLLHSSPGEFDIYSLPAMSLRGEKWVSLMLKSAEAITLTPIKLSNDLDTLLPSPLVLLFPRSTWMLTDLCNSSLESFSGGTLYSTSFTLQSCNVRTSGKETSGCVLGQKLVLYYSLKRLFHGVFISLVQTWPH